MSRRKLTVELTSREMTLIVASLEVQLDAMRDELRYLRGRALAKAKREIVELENLIYRLTGDQT